MSGAEAVLILGIISNTLQLVDFACKALERIKECKDDASHIPKFFSKLQCHLPLIAHALEITGKQAEIDDAFDESSSKILLPVLYACQLDVNKLKSILQKLTPSTSETGWKRNFKALTSVFYDKDVETIASSLSQSLTVINQYHGAYTAATTGAVLRKLTAAVAAIPENEAARSDSSKVYFMVPTVWSGDVSGRKDTMKRLDALMSDETRHRRVAIVGLGGIGKTRVMIQYAYKFKDSTALSVFWLHASSMSRVNKACLEIARTVKIAGCDDPKSNKLEIVKEWLESPQSGKWLLLVDNADDFDLFYGSNHLARLLPRSHDGAIVMTTRDAKVGMEFSKSSKIFLEALTTQESMELVAARLGAKEVDADEDELRELGQELCGNPLALVQASSFITQNYLSIPDYLELYRGSDRDKIALLSEDFDDEVRDAEIRNPVATTWSVSFESIRKRDPLAAEVLSLMSMLDAQAIPESLIRFGHEHNSMNHLKFSKAMGTLQAFSMIEVRKEVKDGPLWQGRRERAFDLHRLVRLAMRSWLSHHGELESHTARALAIMAERYTDCDWETRGKWTTYLPHAAILLATDHLARLEDVVVPVQVEHGQLEETGTLNHKPDGIICPVCAASLFAILASCHYILGIPLLSLEEAEKAYRLRRRYMGENHRETLAALDLIARPAKDLYKFPRAVEVCQLAIKGKSETLGPDHPSTLASMAQLGLTYRPMGKLQEAKEIGMLALSKRCKVLGATHPDTLASLGCVATVIRALGDYEGAVQLETERLQGWGQLPVSSNPQKLEAMAGLGWAYASQGKYDQAAQLTSLSLKEQLEIRGPKYPFTLWTMSNMAVILGMQGKYSDAEKLGERTLSLRHQYLGVSHPFCYVSKLHLAWVYNETGRYQDAEKIELEVLAFQKNFYGSETHHEALLTRSQLASTYAFLGKHRDAEHIKRGVLISRLKQTGELHPVTLRCKSSLGMTLLELGEPLAAMPLLMEALECQRELLGNGCPDTITTMSRVAKLYHHQSRWDDASDLYKNTVQASIVALGEKHPRTERRMEDLKRFEGSYRLAATRFETSEPHTRKVEVGDIDIQKLGIKEDEANDNMNIS